MARDPMGNKWVVLASAALLFYGFATRKEHTKWFLLLCAAWLLWSAISGIVTGRTCMFYTDYARSDPGNGYMYWFAVVVSATLGIALLAFVALGK
jgi:hypothetical protein